MIRQTMHRQVFLLASAQALFQTASVLVMTVGGLAGAQISPRPALATLPIASMFLEVGRRAGFVSGALLGFAGGVIAAAGVWLGSLALLSAGTFLVGSYQAFAQFYRFAAGEVADDAFRPRAISFVLAGGIVAALLGPMLGRLGGPLLEPQYVGSFLLMAAVSLFAAGALLGVRVPAAPTQQGGAPEGRPWRGTNDMTIFVVGLACSFSAGALQYALGWKMLNVALLPWLVAAAAVLIWYGRRSPAGESIPYGIHRTSCRTKIR